MSTRANSTRKLPNSRRFTGSFQPLESTTELVVHQGHLQAESARLGMDAVTAADHGSELVVSGFFRNHLAQFAYVLDQNVCRLNHLNRESGVPYVAAGETKMQPSAGWRTDVLSHIG